MTELAILVQPAAFLVTLDGGTHEITRCYFQNGKYAISSYSNARLGQHSVVGAELRADGTLHLHFTGGYSVLIPSHRLQTTYRL